MFNKRGIHHTGVHVKSVELWGFMEVGKWDDNGVNYTLDVAIGSFVSPAGVVGLSLFMLWGHKVVWRGPIAAGGRLYPVQEAGNEAQQKKWAEVKMHQFFLMVYHGRDRIVQHLLLGHKVPAKWWEIDDRQ